MKKVITFISDTHGKHEQVGSFLPGGDFLFHAGDFMNSGYYWNELTPFLEWFDGIKGYEHKLFIAGNHDRLFENEYIDATRKVREYKTIGYLQDSKVTRDDVKIYGSPWQPEFYGWAFNLPRNGEDLREKWFWIPDDTDVLITHGPPYGTLDVAGMGAGHVGDELLAERLEVVKPKIHVFGHIHGGYGYKFDGHTHYFNASVLNERYSFTNKPMTVIWDTEKNEVEFLD